MLLPIASSWKLTGQKLRDLIPKLKRSWWPSRRRICRTRMNLKLNPVISPERASLEEADLQEVQMRNDCRCCETGQKQSH